MLKYIQITNENLDFATNIQMTIFPDESAYEHYKFTINKNVEYENYYLVYDNDIVIGITGLYSNEDIYETNSIWLGWFGVLEEHRKKGYGEQILIDTINIAKEFSKKYPIKYFRFYTSERDNYIAQFLYSKVMDIKEYYNNPNDVNYDNTCIIYSKSLSDEPVSYWNNRFLNLKEIIEAEELSNKNEKINNIMNVMETIEYGFKDESGNNIINTNSGLWENEFDNFYYLQTPEELLKTKCGVCWDQVELERELFLKEKINIKTYFIYIADEDMLPSHTFLTYELNNKYYWFEHSWGKYKGVHEYSSERELLLDITKKFREDHKEISENAVLYLYEYNKPKKHIKCNEFYKYIETQKKIEI